jgi:hypothetical protein
MITFYLVALLKNALKTKKHEQKEEGSNFGKILLIFGIILIISIMNGALRFFLGFMSNFERKHSETERL